MLSSLSFILKFGNAWTRNISGTKHPGHEIFTGLNTGGEISGEKYQGRNIRITYTYMYITHLHDIKIKRNGFIMINNIIPFTVSHIVNFYYFLIDVHFSFCEYVLESQRKSFSDVIKYRKKYTLE